MTSNDEVSVVCWFGIVVSGEAFDRCIVAVIFLRVYLLLFAPCCCFHPDDYLPVSLLLQHSDDSDKNMMEEDECDRTQG